MASSRTSSSSQGPKRPRSTGGRPASSQGPADRKGQGGPAKPLAKGGKESKDPKEGQALPKKPLPPAAPRETVSLIDKEKPARRRPANSGGFPLPPISRILAPEPPKPAPAPEAAEEELPEDAAAPETVEAAAAAAAEVVEEVSDEKVIHIKPPIIVKDLAVHLGLKHFQLISELMEMNIFKAINDTLDPEVVAILCKNHGFVFEKEKRERGGGVHKVEVVVEAPKPPPPPKEDELRPRAPIVTFMGHVDHGKTSLMDSIRKARVAKGEAGGITQHIGAYTVEHNGHGITFLDTPGHAAFTAMRARGANVTDIVVLVVAADDGVMPQTIEALNHAKAAGVPIIVAANKIDLPAANLDRLLGQLQEQGLTPEDWGGETMVCPVSALKGEGIDHLLEMLLLQAEMLELKASPTVAPRGTVVEAKVEAGRGPTATVLVRMGKLKVGQPFICGNFYGKVKNLVDDKGKSIKEAGPSTPVQVLGFSGLPNAGDEFVAMDTEKAAKALSEERLQDQRTEKLSTPRGRTTLEDLFSSIAADAKKVLRIVVKADVQGTLEALVGSLREIESKKVNLEILHAAVGPITESDVLLSTASNAVILGYGVKVENTAAAAAKREGVQIKLYSIIYELLDQVKEAMAGLLDPETRETVIGHAEVKQVFSISRGTVAGCAVTDGRILKTARARIVRKKQTIYDGPIGTLRRFQDDVKEVRTGLECGIKLGDFNDYEAGDVIECYQLEKFKQLL